VGLRIEKQTINGPWTQGKKTEMPTAHQRQLKRHEAWEAGNEAGAIRRCSIFLILL
jgi:hypothetical protein